MRSFPDNKALDFSPTMRLLYTVQALVSRQYSRNVSAIFPKRLGNIPETFRARETVLRALGLLIEIRFVIEYFQNILRKHAIKLRLWTCLPEKLVPEYGTLFPFGYLRGGFKWRVLLK